MLNRGRKLAHGGCAAGNLVDGLRLGALGGQRSQKRGVLRRAGLSAHNLAHYRIGLVKRQVALHDDLLDGFLNHVDPLFLMPEGILAGQEKPAPRLMCPRTGSKGARGATLVRRYLRPFAECFDKTATYGLPGCQHTPGT